MALENLNGSLVMTPFSSTPRKMAPPGLSGGRVHYFCETVEMTAAANAASTYDLAILPSNAVLTLQAQIYWDDLASTGSPTAKLGLFNAAGKNGITNDDDCFFTGADLATANAGKKLIGDIANIGKALWQFVNGQTEDPRHQLILRLTTASAACDTGGTITVEGYYVLE